MSTSEHATPHTEQTAETITVVSGSTDEVGPRAGTLCVYTEPNYKGGSACLSQLRPGVCRPISGGPIRSAHNDTDHTVHFYEKKCNDRPYFDLKPGQSSHSFPFPVNQLRVDR